MLTGAELLQREGESRVNPKDKDVRARSTDSRRNEILRSGRWGRRRERRGTVGIAVIATSRSRGPPAWAGSVCQSCPATRQPRALRLSDKSSGEMPWIWETPKVAFKSRKKARCFRTKLSRPGVPVYRSGPSDALVSSTDSLRRHHRRRTVPSDAVRPAAAADDTNPKKETLIGSFPSEIKKQPTSKNVCPRCRP